MKADNFKPESLFIGAYLCPSVDCFKRITIRMVAQAVKSRTLVLEHEWRKHNALVLRDFPVDKRLNDGAEEFLRDDVHNLRAHLVQDALDHGFD
jgi:hypothetical protein